MEPLEARRIPSKCAPGVCGTGWGNSFRILRVPNPDRRRRLSPASGQSRWVPAQSPAGPSAAALREHGGGILTLSVAVSTTSLRRFWQWLFRDWGPSSGLKTSYEARATIVSPYSPKPGTGQPILPGTIQSRSGSITERTDEKIIPPDDSSHHLCLEASHDFICTSFFSG